MNVVISTLYCGEPQYEKCRDAIRDQDYRPIHHNVIAFKDNLEAHAVLYRSFFEDENEFDLMIKVDADMVLMHNHAVSELVRPFENDDRLDQFNIQVNDFFTNSNIFGIEVFRKGLTYRERRDFFVDRAVSGQRRVLTDNGKDGVVAFHCFEPDLRQAYSFGLHRAAKDQDDIITLLLNHFRTNRHPMLAAACMGAIDLWSGNIKATPRKYKIESDKVVQERCGTSSEDFIENRLSGILTARKRKQGIRDFLFRIIRRLL